MSNQSAEMTHTATTTVGRDVLIIFCCIVTFLSICFCVHGYVRKLHACCMGSLYYCYNIILLHMTMHAGGYCTYKPSQRGGLILKQIINDMCNDLMIYTPYNLATTYCAPCSLLCMLTLQLPKGAPNLSWSYRKQQKFGGEKTFAFLQKP